ncbi:Cation/H(+) antiporter 15 [Nymphaea thermarum]|nr:Cation/H(+) antiporter 15 [Nymphaea thermarum]
MGSYARVNATWGDQFYSVAMNGTQESCGSTADETGDGQIVTRTLVLQIMVPLTLIHLIHLLLRRTGQPFFVAEMMAVVVLSILSPVKSMYSSSFTSLELLVGHTLPVLGFRMGLDMSFSSFWNSDLGAFSVAAGATLFSIALTSACGFFYLNQAFEMPHSLFLAVFWSLIFSNVSSPVLIQVSTELKLIRTRIGRLALSAGLLSDLSTLLFFGFAITQATTAISRYHGPEGTVAFIVVLLLLRGLIGWGAEWVNRQNPEGKRMKSGHLLILAVLESVAIFLGQAVGTDSLYAAFLLGLVFHKEGRLVREVKSWCNALCSYLILPMFMLKVGMHVDLASMNSLQAWGVLLLLITLITMGKLVGTVVACSRMGIPLDEGAVLGFLLSIKGYVHVVVAQRCFDHGLLEPVLFTQIILAILVTDVLAPMLVMTIVQKARHTSPLPRMALQWMDSGLELRVLACIEDKRDVPSMVNLVEGLRGPTESRLMVYAMHLVELPDDGNTVLVYQENQQHMEVVTSTEALDQQNQIAATFRSYAQQAGDGLVVRHMATASSFSTMHEDVCNAAEDMRATLLVLPFHRHQRVDGRMDLGNLGFQSVHRKVLRHAPCSIAILVDRGLGGTSLLSATQVSHHVAAIFLGGPDDREAMAFAARLAEHRGISLSVVRFLPDARSEPSSRVSSLAPFNVGPDSAGSMAEAAKEAEADEECIAAFRERYVAAGIASYVEKYVSSGVDTVTRLGELESLYTLFVVGRGGHTSSVVISGMREWEETPELGPLGDVLSSSDFSVTASVIVVQLHKTETGTDVELL